MSTADYNARVAEALKTAMRLRGMEGNKSAFARLLRALVGDGPAPNTVGRWLSRQQVIPAWALVASAQAADADLGELLGLEAQASPEQLRAMRAELERQRSTTEAMQRRMEDLAAQLAARAPAPAAGAGSQPVAAAATQKSRELKPLAAAIIVRGDRVLLTERRFPGFGEQWSWPSGKVEGDESLEDAILRELHEELLIAEARVIRYVGDIDLPSGFRMSHFHVAIPSDSMPKLNDYEQLVRTEWMTRDKVQQAFSSLPPEIARRALEFLDQVLADVQIEAMDRASAQPDTEQEERRRARGG